ncbi:MAG TPA: hypothetical protein VLK25_05250, partial [Allosphingosinicella sp.]|nr:hypothetical protein [Allosphingosinicella sp.]
MRDSVVAPFAAPTLSAEHYQGVFGALHTSIDLAIADFSRRLTSQVRLPPASSLIEILRAFKEAIPNESYARIQRAHLPGRYEVPGHIKYLDAPGFLISKFNVVRMLELLDDRKRSILDLGSGPAHVLYLARALGHGVLATDLTWPPSSMDGKSHLFDDLRAILGIPFAVLDVKKKEPIRFEGRFDLITALDIGYGAGWSADDWDWHIEDLLNNVLLPSGILCLQPLASRTDPEAWSHI